MSMFKAFHKNADWKWAFVNSIHGHKSRHISSVMQTNSNSKNIKPKQSQNKVFVDKV